MDYDKFKTEWDKMDPIDSGLFAFDFGNTKYKKDPIVLGGEDKKKNDYLNLVDSFYSKADDRVNSPSHYTAGSQEAIVTIEEAIEHAPSVSYGMLQAQVLKYLLRVWHKDNPLEDLRKARWYLNRLISKMEGN